MCRIVVPLEIPDHQLLNTDLYEIGDVIAILRGDQTVGWNISRAEYEAMHGNTTEFDAQIKPLIINLVWPDGTHVPPEKLTQFLETAAGSIKRRLKHLDYTELWQSLSQAKKKQILTQKEITVTTTALKSFLKDKATGTVIDVGI